MSAVLKRCDDLQVSRLAEIGMNAQVLTHELRQPIQAIKLSLEFALREASESEILAHVHDALSEVDRLGELLERTYEFIQPGPGEKTPLEAFDLNEVVRRVARLLEHSVRKGSVKLQLDLGTLPPVRGVRAHAEQILFNLMTNARDSLEERGKGGRLALLTRVSGGHGEVVVADDGVGIDPALTNEIFEAYTTSKGRRGCGLGLYIARRLATSFGGVLRVADPRTEVDRLDPPPRAALVLELPLAEGVVGTSGSGQDAR
jgi:signal transduction histidine kinase